MPISVSPISNSNFNSFVNYTKLVNKSEYDGIRNIAPIDERANHDIPRDESNTINTNRTQSNDKSNESYNSAGLKTTLAKSSNIDLINKNSNSINKSTNEQPNPEKNLTVADLEKRDSEARAHENAHRAVGGELIKGGTIFTYTTGPDGKQYATGGEVQIDISPVKGDPEATIEKMNRVRAAALAPADPSPQDRSVASLASAIASSARAELSKQPKESPVINTKQYENFIKSYQKNELISNKQAKSTVSEIYAGSVASLKE